MVWMPHVTVAAVIENKGRFLLVEEETDDGVRFNQPAGHLEADESLLEAVTRETVEETAYRFVPEYLVGFYRWPHPTRDLTYLRFAFGGALGEQLVDRTLDAGIIAARWLSLEEIEARASQLRSPLVLRCCQDWLAACRYPLEVLTHFPGRAGGRS